MSRTSRIIRKPPRHIAVAPVNVGLLCGASFGVLCGMLAAPTAHAEQRPDIDAGIYAADDWASCRLPVATPPLDPRDPRQIPIDISAAEVTAGLAAEQVVFAGDVVLRQGDLEVFTDRLVINRDTGEADAQGYFLATRPDVRVAGDAAHFELTSRTGRVDNASYRVPALRARGDAASAAFLGDRRSRYESITFTTCRPGRTDWQLRAATLELDHAEGLGTATDASLRFMDVPVLWAPTFTFPIDDRRRSGVLVPRVGYSGNTGLDLSVPYYFNLAENYDLTVTPRLMSKRGLLLGGEFRFLTESTRGQLQADILPYDRETEEARGAASLYSHSQFGARTEADLRLNYVSDDTYLQDLGGSLAVTSATYLERAAELRYHADTWNLLGRVQGYQTLDDAIAFSDRPYDRLPQLRLDLLDREGIGGTSYELAAEYVYFHRDDSVRGHRVDLYPALSLPLRRAWGFLEPRVGARYTAYSLDDQPPGQSASPSNTTGIFSVDSGLWFDRATRYFGDAVTQTLEPRLYYLYVPDRDQSDQPVFDTARLDFSFDNLFRDNRFSGPDRVADANQATLALTTRVLADASGEELLRASVGQTLYFDGRDVTLPGESPLSDSSSSFVGEISAILGGGWRTRAGLQWDPHNGSRGRVEQALAQVVYQGEHRQVFSAAYRMRDGVVEQTDIAAIWPVNERISLIGRHNYSLEDDRMLETLIGVEYGRCCWRVRALLRDYTDGVGDDHNLAFMLQLELNGLGRLGNDIDSTLERGIYGYRRGNDD